MGRSSIGMLALAFVLAGAALARAEERATGDDTWRFGVTPIAIWGLNVEGPVVIDGTSQNVNASFSDIKNNLDSSAGLGLSIGKGAWRGALFGSYLKLRDEDVTSSAAPGVEADVFFEWTTIELSGSYRLPVTPAAKSPMVELTAGARFNRMEIGVEATKGSTFEEERDLSWTDPFVGMSVNQPIAKGLLAVLRGDVGGFGLSSNQTKYTWNFTGGMGYRWPLSGGTVFAFGGYKITELDLERSDPATFQMIQRLQGPVVNVSFAF